MNVFVTAVVLVAVGTVKLNWLPPVKSMPLFSPCTPRLIAHTTRNTPEIANQTLVRPMKSYFFQRSPVPTWPSTRGLDMNEKPASRLSIARVATTAVKIDTSTPRASITAKPLTLEVATRISTAAVISVTTLASMIVLKPRR